MATTDPYANPNEGERLLSALRSLDDLTRRDERWVWDDINLFFLFARLFGVTVQMLTVDPDEAWNVHLVDEVLVLDTSGKGDHKLLSPGVWALSAEFREAAFGLDGTWG